MKKTTKKKEITLTMVFHTRTLVVSQIYRLQKESDHQLSSEMEMVLMLQITAVVWLIAGKAT